ncbi:hypothetical protein N7519_010614 [Penicillium mononematosum]|uniref:uncharacterized protein n=1 Tax=Penicillium mononematosum TaxID=268346 RepID=UPI002548C15C|nr:uncharacterized protein N7519_010614 [Penicillium mononematosum]KAJ6180153.1 hypothetical protein N7519_010614 [Penicillium mononematosum]
MDSSKSDALNLSEMQELSTALGTQVWNEECKPKPEIKEVKRESSGYVICGRRMSVSEYQEHFQRSGGLQDALKMG